MSRAHVTQENGEFVFTNAHSPGPTNASQLNLLPRVVDSLLCLMSVSINRSKKIVNFNSNRSDRVANDGVAEFANSRGKQSKRNGFYRKLTLYHIALPVVIVSEFVDGSTATIQFDAIA